MSTVRFNVYECYSTRHVVTRSSHNHQPYWLQQKCCISEMNYSNCRSRSSQICHDARGMFRQIRYHVTLLGGHTKIETALTGSKCLPQDLTAFQRPVIHHIDNCNHGRLRIRTSIAIHPSTPNTLANIYLQNAEEAAGTRTPPPPPPHPCSIASVARG